ncbi:MAG TPA: cytochrome c nitrite reductase small subunit [Polyangiaceae bacterium]|nr:cytochrome c nitrite reductase small subunit [Polyangiaceae bacterium]
MSSDEDNPGNSGSGVAPARPVRSPEPATSGKRPFTLPTGPLLLSIALGILAGIGSYTFSYAKGLSYLSTDPRACVNCHIMQREYDGWQKASHHTSAVCVDCHLPVEFIPKYVAKTENGWRHGKLFTTGGFVEPIEIKPAGLVILQQNCIRCHASLTADMRAHGSLGTAQDKAGVPCLHCHANVGHGDRAGLGGPIGEAEKHELQQLSNKASAHAPAPGPASGAVAPAPPASAAPSH